VIFILDQANAMTIATVGEEGYPPATRVSYVNDGLTVYFGCAAESQKAENIARSDKVSLTVSLPYASWDEIRDLSIGGKAAPVAERQERDRVGALMFQKFPQIVQYAPTDMEGLMLFRFGPEVVSVLDYRKGFGHTDLVNVVA